MFCCSAVHWEIFFRTFIIFSCQIAVLMSAGFLAAWLPYAAVSFWVIFNPSLTLSPVISLLPSLFAKSSAAYNPVIISIMSSRFRSDTKKLMGDICLGAKQEVASTERRNVGDRGNSPPQPSRSTLDAVTQIHSFNHGSDNAVS